MLRQDIDRCVIRRQQPDLHHVGVRQGDAAIGPVGDLVIRRCVLQLVGEPVDHDRAAGIPMILACTSEVGLVRIGDLERKEVFAARIAAREEVVPLGSTEVAGTLFLADRIDSESDFVGAHDRLAMHEDEMPVVLVHDQAIDGRQALSRPQHDALRLGQRVTVGRDGYAEERQGGENSTLKKHHLSSKQALA